jgi:hypothetical protein
MLFSVDARRIMRNYDIFRLEHFVIENIYPDKMLWRCEANRSNARESGAGGPCPPLRDNLTHKMP